MFAEGSDLYTGRTPPTRNSLSLHVYPVSRVLDSRQESLYAFKNNDHARPKEFQENGNKNTVKIACNYKVKVG